MGLLPQGLSRSDMFPVMLGLTAGGSDDGNNNMTLDQFRRRQLLQHRPAARVPGIYDVRKFRTVLNQPCRRANA